MTENLETSEKAKILRARAAELARAVGDERTAADTLDLVEFRYGEERYAFEASAVKGVHRFENLTPLPGAPDFIAGIVSVRGRILPVINIQSFFELPRQGITDNHIFMVVSAKEIEVGFLADNVVGMRTIPVESVQAKLPTFSGISEQYIKGLTPEQLVILDTEKILGDPRMTIQQQSEP